VDCATPDPCHTGDQCDSKTGLCLWTFSPNGSSCDDGNACTQKDTCEAGYCRGATIGCPAPANECLFVGHCEATAGECVYNWKPERTACGSNGECQKGECKPKQTGGSGCSAAGGAPVSSLLFALVSMVGLARRRR